MSYIRAPRLHQSTALLCPLRIKISGALQRHQAAFLTNELQFNERAYEVERERARLTCIRWCRRMCGWPCRRESTLCKDRSLSTLHGLEGSHTYSHAVTYNPRHTSAFKLYLLTHCLFIMSNESTHLGCWAWCSQALGLCRWCPSGAGGPEPWRSLPGRN